MGANTIEINGENIETTISGNDIVILDFWASWCGPCRAFAPVFEAASEKHTDIAFGKVDTEANRDLSAALQIQSIPTVMVFREGVLVYRQPGALPAPAFDELIGEVRKLDMEDVRKQIAEHQNGHEA